MTVAVRPLDNAELERSTTKLRRLVYQANPAGSYNVDWHSSIWGWLETHVLADEMHRWVLVTDEGEVVGHLAAIPQYYWIGGERVVAHTPADYYVLPGYGFYAIPLMRQLFRTVENCVTVDQVPEAIAVETRLGAEETGKLQFAVKLRDLSRLSDLPAPMPMPIRRPLGWSLRMVDRALSSTLFTDQMKVEALEGFDTSFDELFESIAAAVPCVPEKDAAFLRWRYGPGSPQHPVTVLGVRDGWRLLGYAVLSVLRGQNGNLLDLTTRPERHDVVRSLLRVAIRHFARAGVHIVRYRFLESPTAPRTKDLWRLGFFPRNATRHTLLVKFADHSLHKTALDPANWSYSAGDGELGFFDRHPASTPLEARG